MHRLTTLLIGIAVAVFALAAQAPDTALARTKEFKGPAQQGPLVKYYDVATETTLSGTVTDYKPVSYKRGVGRSATADLKLDDGSVYIVKLAPPKFWETNGFALKFGDKLEVTGSKVEYLKKTYVSARKVTKDGKTVEVRDDKGNPKWKGGRAKN